MEEGDGNGAQYSEHPAQQRPGAEWAGGGTTGLSTQVGRDQILERLLCQAWEFHLQPLVKLQFIKSR